MEPMESGARWGATALPKGSTKVAQYVAVVQAVHAIAETQRVALPMKSGARQARSLLNPALVGYAFGADL